MVMDALVELPLFVEPDFRRGAGSRVDPKIRQHLLKRLASLRNVVERVTRTGPDGGERQAKNHLVWAGWANSVAADSQGSHAVTLLLPLLGLMASTNVVRAGR
jgi:hypothetical protein